jgi:hypothetical protein
MWDEQVDDEEDSDTDDDNTLPKPTQEQSPITTETDPTEPELQQRHRSVSIRSRRGPSRQHKPVTLIQPVTRKQVLQQLWENIESSKDKLFFIQEKETGQLTAKWYLVQVDRDETKRQNAISIGEYHVRWLIKNEPQAKTEKTRKCAFWPLIKELLPNIGAIVMFRPQKAITILEQKPYKYAWYQREINLVEGKLHGPFDYGKNFTIDDAHWDALRTATSKTDIHVDISDVNRIVPLTSKKR